MDDEVLIPYPRVAAFVRQHTHDVRNFLNGLDLEASLVAEIVTDPEAVESLARLRAQIRETANSLRALSTRVGDPQPGGGSIAARDIFLVWQDEAAGLGLESTAWTDALGEERLKVDPGGLSRVFAELLANAKRFGDGARLVALAAVSDGRVSFELREAKSARVDPAAWGRTPFHSTHRGAYGLGLWEADRIVRANGGKVERTVLPDGTLVTKLSFPRE